MINKFHNQNTNLNQNPYQTQHRHTNIRSTHQHTNQTILQHRNQQFESTYDANQLQTMHIHKIYKTKLVHIKNIKSESKSKSTIPINIEFPNQNQNPN